MQAISSRQLGLAAVGRREARLPAILAGTTRGVKLQHLRPRAESSGQEKPAEAKAAAQSGEAKAQEEIDPEQFVNKWKPDAGQNNTIGQFFGTYLQLGVWVAVLCWAGVTGYQRMQVAPEEAGLLIAPPFAALFLILSFLFFRVLNREKQEE